MADIAGKRGAGNMWRIAGWGAAVALLGAPFVAMELHAEGVDWTLSDFIFAGLLFAIFGGLLELAVRQSKSASYRAGAATALLAGLLVVWSNLAVGIVGSEDNPLNLLFFAALLIGIVIAAVGRFRATGMASGMIGTAISLAFAFLIATSFGTDEPNVSHWIELAGVSIFALLFTGSVALFRRAGRLQSSSSS